MNALAVFIGGGLGSLCRWGIALCLVPYKTSFPHATLIANILSCILIGYLLALGMKSNLSDPYKSLLVVGFCGGFSTFSTFSKETYLLFKNGDSGLAIMNILGSVALCLAAIYLGIQLARWLHS